MDLRLAHKTAVVTGASRGIGLATVKALVAEGVRVVGVARAITPELERSGAVALSGDLSTEAGVTDVMYQAFGGLGGIDLLVNNAGMPADPAGFLDTSEEQWKRVFDINFLGVARVTRAALPSLIERRGAVVNVSSINAHLPAGAPPAYSASKAALTALGKSLAEEFGSHGVRVNTVSPGPVRTPLWNSPDGFGAKAAASMGVEHGAFLDQVPAMLGVTLGRIGEPEEVAALIAFLLSEAAGNITGADFVIDGGAIKSI